MSERERFSSHAQGTSAVRACKVGRILTFYQRKIFILNLRIVEWRLVAYDEDKNIACNH